MNPQHSTLNCGGRLLSLAEPVIMGILNVTPDSFFDGAQHNTIEAALLHAKRMVEEGAQIIDVGGASSRPGAPEVSAADETDRILPVIAALQEQLPEAIISVDTWRASVAKAAIAAGASIVNDISGGRFDPALWPAVAAAGVPYILMHIQGTPDTMQVRPQYEDVVQEVLDDLIQKSLTLRAMGVKDIILDPGFGFGKNLEHNYALLRNLHVFGQVTGLPVLAGISRKSMICKALGVSPANALNGTTALHMVALQQGACILRVHDVKEAKEVVALWRLLEGV